MKRLRLFAFLMTILGASVLFKTVPVGAYPPQCDEVCDGSNCGATCYIGFDQTTCGDQGYCGGGCGQNYQVVNQYQSGGWEVDYLTDGYCQYFASYQQTWHDVNNCPGSQDYYTCTEGPENGFSSDLYTCCFYRYCFGGPC